MKTKTQLFLKSTWPHLWTSPFTNLWSFENDSQLNSLKMIHRLREKNLLFCFSDNHQLISIGSMKLAWLKRVATTLIFAVFCRPSKISSIFNFSSHNASLLSSLIWVGYLTQKYGSYRKLTKARGFKVKVLSSWKISPNVWRLQTIKR